MFARCIRLNSSRYATTQARFMATIEVNTVSRTLPRNRTSPTSTHERATFTLKVKII